MTLWQHLNRLLEMSASSPPLIFYVLLIGKKLAMLYLTD